MVEGPRATVEILGRQSCIGHRFAILVLCDGEEPGRRALDHLRRTAAAWMDDFVFEVRIWPLSGFAHAAAKIASDELAGADLLILSIEHLDRFNEAMPDHLCAMFQQMRFGRAAVAILTTDNDLMGPGSLDFLQTAAKQAGVDFIFPRADLPHGYQRGDCILPEDVDLQPVD